MLEIYKRHNDAAREEVFFAAEAFRPPEDMEIDEWAETSLELSARVTKAPGTIRLRGYQREPLRSFRESIRTVIIGGAQVGKTIILQSGFGYVIDQDPGPTMVVYPEQQLAKRRSRKHLRPLIEDSPVLARHMTGKKDDLQLFEYNLDRMTVIIAWSGSPSQMAGEPIRYLFRDEFAKFAGATDKEADALSLSERRTISYTFMKRIFDVTTPTIRDAAGWRDLVHGTFETYHVPCPHCGEFQPLRFPQFKFPSRDKDEKFIHYRNRVLKNTYYECEQCQGIINDLDKMKMIEIGEWRPDNPEAEYRSFQMPSWLSPDVKFGEVAARFVDGQTDVEKLQDWVNSDCAEPWEEKGENADSAVILTHRADYPPGTVPTEETVLTCITVDVQKDYIWYLVRAHTFLKSWLVEYGTLAVLDDVEQIMIKQYTKSNGKLFCPNIRFIDSGYRTTEVYEYVITHEYSYAIKGQDGHQGAPIRWQPIKKYPGSDKELPGNLNLCHIHTPTFKEKLLLTFRNGFDDDGYNSDFDSWFLHNETGEGYARHLTAETVVEHTKKNGQVVREWKKIRRRNDLFDCEVYQLAFRYLFREELQRVMYQTTPEKQEEPDIPEVYRR